MNCFFSVGAEQSAFMVRDYCGNYEYENGRLVRINTENGYIDGNGIYNAYIKDYQGNNRVTVSHTGQYFDVTNYYPYGMPYADLNGYDRYKYSGKEIETANGLNHYDFHARSHDFALGQFTGQDKKAVDYASVSPYTYCTADPVNNIDPTGMETYVFKLENGKYEVRGGVLNGDLNVYEVDAEGNKLGSIGISAFPTSFYNVDLENDRSSVNFGKSQGWSGYIDLADNSG